MDESAQHLEALENAVERGDKAAALQATSELMSLAEVEADLAAAGTAIDSNLAKLDEIARLTAALEEAKRGLRRLARDDIDRPADQSRAIARKALNRLGCLLADEGEIGDE